MKTYSCTHPTLAAWWQVDLNSTYKIDVVVIATRELKLSQDKILICRYSKHTRVQPIRHTINISLCSNVPHTSRYLHQVRSITKRASSHGGVFYYHFERIIFSYDKIRLLIIMIVKIYLKEHNIDFPRCHFNMSYPINNPIPEKLLCGIQYTG